MVATGCTEVRMPCVSGGRIVDRASPAFGGTGPGTLHANYHVVAEVAGGPAGPAAQGGPA